MNPCCDVGSLREMTQAARASVSRSLLGLLEIELKTNDYTLNRAAHRHFVWKKPAWL